MHLFGCTMRIQRPSILERDYFIRQNRWGLTGVIMHCSKLLRKLPSRLKEKDKELFSEARRELGQEMKVVPPS